MLVVAAAVMIAAAIAGVIYLRQEKLGLEGLGFAVLRTVGFTALILLIFNPSCSQRGSRGPPIVLLDRSLSMGAAGGRWTAALDTARAIAGSDGTVLGFGHTVGPLADSQPTDGLSRIRMALAETRALGRPTTVVTDGELTDAGDLPSSLVWGVTMVLLPRDAVPGAALVAVGVPERVQLDDSIPVAVTIAAWGDVLGDTLILDILEGERRLLSRSLGIPQTPAVLQRRVVLPARRLGTGLRVMELRVTLDGDRETRDNVRQRVITVTEQPAIVVIVDPADWEGRFLLRILSDVSGVPVRGFARIGMEQWIDMRSLESVSLAQLRGAVRTAGLVVARGSNDVLSAANRRGPVWRWPAGDTVRTALLRGDWYLARQVPASPLAGALTRLEWDSLPPLTAVRVSEPDSGDWVAVTAQLGRRGAARPVLLGRGLGRDRELITVSTGLWRWTFRGGAGLEAVRTLLAAGVDWLLQSDRAARGEVRLASGPVVRRSTPLVLEWSRSSVPDSAVVRFTADSVEREYTLFPDPEGRAQVALDPGVYRWTVPGAASSGLAVVEEYSDEFLPRQVVAIDTGVEGSRVLREEVFLRQRWWLFFLAVLVFSAEWAWRQRRGLP
ncbi:MAG: hypothetical protein V3T20_10395 [Gemmatimonadota bacterium]